LGPQQVSVSILIHSGRLASKINGIRLLVVFFVLFPFFWPEQQQLDLLASINKITRHEFAESTLGAP